MLAKVGKMNASQWMSNRYNDFKKLSQLQGELASGSKFRKWTGQYDGDELTSTDITSKSNEIKELKERRELIYKLLIETGIAHNDLRRELTEMFSDGTKLFSDDERGARDKALRDFDNFATSYSNISKKINKVNEIVKEDSGNDHVNVVDLKILIKVFKIFDSFPKKLTLVKFKKK